MRFFTIALTIGAAAAQDFRSRQHFPLDRLTPTLPSDGTCHYENPFKGPCQKGETNVSAKGFIDGSGCMIQCDDNLKCPIQDVCPGVSAKPDCGIGYDAPNGTIWWCVLMVRDVSGGECRPGICGTDPDLTCKPEPSRQSDYVYCTYDGIQPNTTGNLIVSAAGTDEVNGIYNKTGDKPLSYLHFSGQYSIGFAYGSWRLSETSGDLRKLYVMADGEYWNPPVDGTWVTSAGDAPPPSVLLQPKQQ